MKAIHDPGGVYWRRALRVAIVLPLTYVFVQYVLDVPFGSGLASFTVYALLGLADFGGPPKSRALAYLTTGLVGTPLIVLGSLLSFNVVVSIVAAGVIAFVVNYSGVLRGYFAAASVALLLPFVMAMTSPPGFHVMFQMCVGFVIAVLVSLVSALLLWPNYLRSDLRLSVSDSLQAMANEIAERWIAQPDSTRLKTSRANTSDSMKRMHSLFDGALVRPGPGTSRDRSLVAVVSELDRLNRVLQWQFQQELDVAEIDSDLARATVDTFRDCASALVDSKVTPDPHRVNAIREQHELLIEDYTASVVNDANRPANISAALAQRMPLRILALSAQSISGNVVGAVGKKLPEGSTAVTLGGQALWDPTDNPSAMYYLTSQFSWKSPWVRNAMRTGIAIALATAIVQITHIPHGMWIVLGTLVALRFDAGGTTRTAAQVLIGTVVGFGIGWLVISFFGTNEVVLWILLPILVFLAAYTPNSISLTVGQASFTVYGVTLYALYLPTGFSTTEFRLIDVFIAMLVSLVVSALLWPRGVVTVVHSTLRVAADQAGDVLVIALTRLTGGQTNSAIELDDRLLQARKALTSAKQSYDLAYAQKGPGVPDIAVWSQSADAIGSVERSAEIVSSVVRHGRTHGGNLASQNSLLRAAHLIDTTLKSTLASEPGRQNLTGELRTAVGSMRGSVDDYVGDQLTTPQSADPRDLTAIVWLAIWLQYAAWEVEFLDA